MASCCGRRSAKNPEGLVGVVLAGIDADDQLRLGFVPPPPQMQTMAANKDNFRFIKICYLLKTSLLFTLLKEKVKPEITKKRKKLRKIRWKRQNPQKSAKSRFCR